MGTTIIDFHVHAFPDLASRWAQFNPLRKAARSWIRPLSGLLHENQPLVRHIPEPLRMGIDQLSGLAPLPGLLVESTIEDLLETMEENEVDQALVIAHPPFSSNEFVMESCLKEDSRLIPVVNIPKDTAKPGTALKVLAREGARALKIHAAADGDGPKCARYKTLLKTATELQLPVILHTGCVHSNLFFRDPEFAKAELFAPWFKTYPETQFVLAHMNWHEPQLAMDLAIENPNVWVDTSWQPAEIIGEAVRRIGAERILFGSDWPLVGNNISISLARIREAVDIDLITKEDSELILGKNAQKLLKLNAP